MKRCRNAFSALLTLTVFLSIFATSAQAFFGNKNDALIKAAKKGDMNKVERLIENGADIKAKDKSGSTSLDWAAYGGHTDVVKFLIKKGEDINTALISAALGGQIDLVQLLIEKNANVNAAYEEGSTPLIFAAMSGHTNVVRLLIDNGADVKAERNGFIHNHDHRR